MRRIDRFRPRAGFAVALSFVLALSAFFPAAAQERPVLRIGMHDQPPLSIPGGQGPFDQMLLELFRRAGAEAEFVYMPYERSLFEANAGTIDGEGSRLAGLEKLYPNLVRVPESTFLQEFVAFAVKPGITLHGWDSLQPYTVGYLIGWKTLEENVRAASVSAVPDPRSLFAMLKNGRIDIAIYERHGGMHSAREMGIAGAYAVEPPLMSQPLYLYLNSKYADLVPELARALRDMKADGTYAGFFTLLR